MSAPLTVPETATVTLDLNGFVLKGTGSSSVIENNGNLTLVDSNSTAVHKYTNGSNGLYTWDDEAGTIELTGGAIVGGKSTVHNAGGVLNHGTFTMEGGSIVGNTATFGGGVYNDENGTFTMEGGSIVGNTAELYGGGVYNYSTFTMEGGSITGNTVIIGRGGSVYCHNGTFTMEGGGIKDEINRYSGTITISGGYFGVDARSSIDTSWLGSGRSWADSYGTKLYPKSAYPYKVI